MIRARSIAPSRALCGGRTSVTSCVEETGAGELAAGCCASSPGTIANIGKIRATHVRSFMFIAKPPNATALVRRILRSLVWLVGVLLASSKDTKYAVEKTFFVRIFGLRLTFC